MDPQETPNREHESRFLGLPPELRAYVYHNALWPVTVHPDRRYFVVRAGHPHFNVDGSMIDCGNLGADGCNPSFGSDFDITVGCPDRAVGDTTESGCLWLRQAYITRDPQVIDLLAVNRSISNEAQPLVQAEIAVRPLNQSRRLCFLSTDTLPTFTRGYNHLQAQITHIDLTANGSRSEWYCGRGRYHLDGFTGLRHLILRCKKTSGTASTDSGINRIFEVFPRLETVHFEPVMEYDRQGKFTGHTTDPCFTDSDTLAHQLIAFLTQDDRSGPGPDFIDLPPNREPAPFPMVFTYPWFLYF